MAFLGIDGVGLKCLGKAQGIIGAGARQKQEGLAEMIEYLAGEALDHR